MTFSANSRRAHILVRMLAGLHAVSHTKSQELWLSLDTFLYRLAGVPTLHVLMHALTL